MSQLHPYRMSLVVGLGVGVLDDLVSMRSSTTPIIALLGLLGMRAGEAGIQWMTRHANILQLMLHEKSFAIRAREEAATNNRPSCGIS